MPKELPDAKIDGLYRYILYQLVAGDFRDSLFGVIHIGAMLGMTLLTQKREFYQNLSVPSLSNNVPENSNVDCGVWVLGHGWSGHAYSFGPHGETSDTFVYGALVQYGEYVLNEENLSRQDAGKILGVSLPSDTKIVLLTKQQALALEQSQEYSYYYEPSHIGITNPDGTVTSKFGSGHVWNHDPKVVEPLYAKPEYIYLRMICQNDTGVECPVYIMPQYNWHDNERTFRLVLTDGTKRIGTVEGMLLGEQGLGDDRTYFIITHVNNETHGNSRISDLGKKTIEFIRDKERSIAGIILYSEDCSFENENMNLADETHLISNESFAQKRAIYQKPRTYLLDQSQTRGTIEG